VLTVRQLRNDEVRTYLEIHRASVRGLAADHYPENVIEEWAAPITEQLMERVRANSDHEIRLIAELDEVPVGIGAIVLQKSELRACYVVPSAARKGVGTALVRAIERIALEHRIKRLHLVASVNSEPFYLALGFNVIERGDHTLSSDQPMASVGMAKDLTVLPLRSVDAAEAQIVRWCEDHELVRAAIVTSTRAVARESVDKFSDLDVVLVLTDIAPLAYERAWLSDFGEVLAAWRDPDALKRDPPRTCWVTQYADGSKIDFTLWPVELLRDASARLPEQLDVGYRVLLDRDGLTSTLQPARYRAHIPKRPSREEFLALVEDFFLESTYVAKHLWRGDLMPAKFSLDHVMKQGDLRTLLEWRIEIDHNWRLKPGAAGKGLKKFLPPDRYRLLEKTYVGADVAANWAALFDTIALFRDVGIEIAERLGLEYPRDLDDRVTTYLRGVQAEGGRTN